MRLLIIDDHDAMREMLAAWASEYLGADCSVAASLQEAVRVLAEHPFDAVLLDYLLVGPGAEPVVLPGRVVRNEFDLAGWIKTCQPRSRLLIITGFAGPGECARFLALGAEAVFCQPLELEAMMDCLLAKSPTAPSL